MDAEEPSNRVLRILSWNLGHQTRERPIKAPFLDAIETLRPDVVVLNEFVDGATRATLKADLSVLGLQHTRSSQRVGRHNQVAILSRFELRDGSVSGGCLDPMAQSNFLAVRLLEFAMEIVGLRVPAYKSAADKRMYWQALDGIVRSDPSALFIGDFNADPSYPRSAGGAALVSLERDGWKIPAAEGDWSYCSSRALTRIDHAVVPRSIGIRAARYVARDGDAVFAGLAKDLYDHAALVLDLELPS